MKIEVLYDNEARPGLEAAWGFSCLVGDEILFDTGGRYEILRKNMELLGVNPESISHLVVSHDHWDHSGGLEILERMGTVKVIVPMRASRGQKQMVRGYPNARLFEVDDQLGIREGVHVIGGFGEAIDEIVLIMESCGNLTVITGCAHPGLERILERANTLGKVHALVGGFHGFDRLDLLAGIELIVPCHCTKFKERILLEMAGCSKPCRAGEVYKV